MSCILNVRDGGDMKDLARLRQSVHKVHSECELS